MCQSIPVVYEQPAYNKGFPQLWHFGEGFYGFVFADPDGHTFNAFYM